MTKTKIACIIPSLKHGGMERVMSEVINYLAKDDNISVHLILLTKQNHFFAVDPSVVVHEPIKKKAGLLEVFNLLNYLRKTLLLIKPYSLLSFGSKYNSFVLLAALGTNIRCYVSDRSNPYRNTYLSLRKNAIERHDGIAHFFLKRLLYKTAEGIIVQTKKAAEIEQNSLGHKNIIYLPNPIKEIKSGLPQKEKIILNVGRFISTKQQKLLVEIFAKIDDPTWQLYFLGDGPLFDEVKEYAEKSSASDRICFRGAVTDVDEYYNKAQIFAFTSISEGFPNVIGEALNSELAVISFDCVAGPSDLIQHGKNGFLIPVNDKKAYMLKLQRLMDDASLRRQFVSNTPEVIKPFQRERILRKFKSILTNDQ